MRGLVERFAALEDPRVERAGRHSLLAVVTIARCGVICGADSWVEIEQFGHAKADWFATFLDVPTGIPSHDLCRMIPSDASSRGWMRERSRRASPSGRKPWRACCRRKSSREGLNTSDGLRDCFESYPSGLDAKCTCLVRRRSRRWLIAA